MPVTETAPMAYARSVAAMMWPDDEAARLVCRPRVGRGPSVSDWFVLPAPSRPRILLPSGCPEAARMLNRHGSRLGPRAARFLLASAVRARLLDVLPVPRLRVHHSKQQDGAGESVERYLQDVLGQRVVTGILLGTPRVNRKPVLQVFGERGETVAFVKVAHDAATRSLVRREAENLRLIETAQLRLVEAPRALDVGTVGDVELLVLSPLGSSQEKRDAGDAPVAAMAEVAHVGGVTVSRLTGGPFWERIVGTPPLAPDAVTTARLEHVVGMVEQRYGALELPFGSWHGDWAPWNMGRDGHRVQLWDWERFSDGVPVGLDAVHFRAQRVRHDQPGLPESENSFLAQVPLLLRGVGGASGQADLMVVLYLMELVHRFLSTAQQAGDGALHPRARWALDFSERLLT